MTRWVIQGVELEKGDYIILNEESKISEITPEKIDTIDAIEKDKIIVRDLTVSSGADIRSLSVSENIKADTLKIDGLALINQISANSLSVDPSLMILSEDSPRTLTDALVDVIKRSDSGKSTVYLTNGDILDFGWTGNVDFDVLERDGLVDPSTEDWNVEPEKIKFGINVSSVSNNVFHECPTLKEVWFTERMKRLGSNSFGYPTEISSAVFMDMDLEKAREIASENSSGILSGNVSTFNTASQEWVVDYVGTGTEEIKEMIKNSLSDVQDQLSDISISSNLGEIISATTCISKALINLKTAFDLD